MHSSKNNNIKSKSINTYFEVTITAKMTITMIVTRGRRTIILSVELLLTIVVNVIKRGRLKVNVSVLVAGFDPDWQQIIMPMMMMKAYDENDHNVTNRSSMIVPVYP